MLNLHISVRRPITAPSYKYFRHMSIWLLHFWSKYSILFRVCSYWPLRWENTTLHQWQSVRSPLKRIITNDPRIEAGCRRYHQLWQLVPVGNSKPSPLYLPLLSNQRKTVNEHIVIGFFFTTLWLRSRQKKRTPTSMVNTL